jgi:L-glyceraldehyde 3-phosphate reductase
MPYPVHADRACPGYELRHVIYHHHLLGGRPRAWQASRKLAGSEPGRGRADFLQHSTDVEDDRPDRHGVIVGCAQQPEGTGSGRLLPMTYVAAPDRYELMNYRRCGRSGIDLPEVSLGLWHNFGYEQSLETQRAILRRAFDLGITHFDLANNYGPPYGSAEQNFGTLMHQDLRPYRDELIISTKAGYDMWPGPYGDRGSRKYLLASLDQSLGRMGLDYVDIFYSHRFDPDTPLEETMGALHTAVQSGRALYAGISSYSAERTAEAARMLRDLGTPLLIHQPSYSMLNRWIEGGLLDVLAAEGVGCIAFSPLAQGVLTGKYTRGIPAGSRASRDSSLSRDQLSEQVLGHVAALGKIAEQRGQSLAQLALSWALRDPRVTSVLIGASSVKQLEENVAAASRSSFTDAELAQIDRDAVDAGINIWSASSEQ